MIPGFFFPKRNLDYLIIKPYALKSKGAFGSKIYLVVHILPDVVGPSVSVDVADAEDNEHKDGVHHEPSEHGLGRYLVLS